ncbi:MAG: tetratricopeptide repeat-containing sensor histidine kinase [Chloroherpetonaceae bacterium]|nr:tetratricopeptide repeat-containing sensor histidine kinase [Chloroherpetonaceae bacterium]
MERNIDSLQFSHQSPSSHSITQVEKIDIISNLISLLSLSDPREAVLLSELHLEESNRLRYEYGKGIALFFSAKSHLQTGSFLKALKLFNEALFIFQQCNAKEDQLLALWGISETKFMLLEYDSSEKIALELKDLASESNSESGVALAYIQLGFVRKRLHQYRESLQYFSEALSIGKSIGNREIESLARIGIGRIQFLQGHFSSALASFIQALQYFEGVDYKSKIAQVLSFIGEVFESQKEFENAINYYDRSRSVFEQLDHQYGICQSILHTGNAYIGLGEQLNAQLAFERSLGLARKIGNLQLEGKSLLGLGKVFFLEKKFDASYECYRQSLQINESIFDTKAVVLSLIGLANIYLHKNDSTLLSENNLFLKRALDLSADLALAPLQIEVYYLAYSIQKMRGDFEQALLLYEMYHQLKEELSNNGTNGSTQQLIVELETEKVRKEAEIYRQRNENLLRSYQDVIAVNSQLLETDTMRNAILGVAIHDIKNPLQVIKGYADLISFRIKDKEVLDYLKKMKLATDHVVMLISSLLEINKSQNGKDKVFKLTLNRFDFLSLMHSVIETNRILLDRKSQKLVLIIEPSLSYEIVADESKCRESIENLISNAVKYSFENQTITIRLSRTSESLYFSVQDEGQGFSHQEKELLFKKFQKLSAKPTGGEISTGLGLSIIKSYVELHGGTIQAESLGIGKGSVFTIELPTNLSLNESLS